MVESLPYMGGLGAGAGPQFGRLGHDLANVLLCSLLDRASCQALQEAHSHCIITPCELMRVEHLHHQRLGAVPRMPET